MLKLELEKYGIETALEDTELSEDARLSTVIDLDGSNAEAVTEFSADSVVIGYSASYAHEIPEKSNSCSVFLHRPFPVPHFISAFEQDGKPLEQERKVKMPIHQKKYHYLTVDSAEQAAVWGDTRIPLSENEYKVLSVLCENRGETVDRDRIYSILGAEEGNMGDVYICHLRKKIDNPLAIKLIYTVRGKRYMLKN
jgi:hypothetical protein